MGRGGLSAPHRAKGAIPPEDISGQMKTRIRVQAASAAAAASRAP